VQEAHRGRVSADGWPAVSGSADAVSACLERLPCWLRPLIALDRLAAAEQVFEDLNRRARRADNPNAHAIAHRCGGLLLGAQGHIPEAIGEMDAALADHARGTLRPELARTLLDKGALQRRAKHKSAAKHTLEAALALLEPLDAAILKARARDELSRIGLRRPRSPPDSQLRRHASPTWPLPG
jgi:hypothetical protein